MVLCSRCVPNCFAVVENVVPTATGPSVDLRHFQAVSRPLAVTGEIGDVLEDATGRRVDRDPVLETLHAALLLRRGGTPSVNPAGEALILGVGSLWVVGTCRSIVGRGTAMTRAGIEKKTGALSKERSAGLLSLAEGMRARLQRSARDILAIGAEAPSQYDGFGHGRFGLRSTRSSRYHAGAPSSSWRPSVRRQGRARFDLPAGGRMELSAPSVPDELMDQVLSGEDPHRSRPSGEKRRRPTETNGHTPSPERSSNHIERFSGTEEDYAAGAAAHGASLEETR